MNQQVKLPYKFFVQTAKNDYNNSISAFFREFLQNSVDAKSKNIEFKLHEKEGKIFFECRDDGCGMTEDIIQNKLLTLGETSKAAGQTGGFGVAKILIYFCHIAYEIYTLNNVVRGSGGSYDIEKSGNFVQGCHAIVELNKEVMYPNSYVDIKYLETRLLAEIMASYLPNVKITVNDREVKAEEKAGRKICELPEITIHKKLGVPSCYASVRVNGLHMFDHYMESQKFKLTLELKSYSVDVLTTNRDGFKGDCRDTIAKAIAEICSDPSKSKENKTNFYKGKTIRKSPITQDTLTKLSDSLNTKLSGVSSEEISKVIETEIYNTISAAGLTLEQAKEEVKELTNLVQNQIQTGSKVNLQIFDLQSVLAYNVYIMTIGKFKKTPTQWEPAKFNDKQKNLLALWGKIVGLVLRDSGNGNKKYDVGYVFDDGTQGEATLALYQQLNLHGEVLDVFYLNPCSYGDQKFFPASQDRKQEVLMWLLALAIHEVAHYIGYSGHNSSFVSAEAALKLKAFKNIGEYLAL